MKKIPLPIDPLLLIWFEVQTGWTWIIDTYTIVVIAGALGINILWKLDLLKIEIV